MNHTSVSPFYAQSIIKVENNFIKAPYNFLPVLNREFLYLQKIRDQCSLYRSYKYEFILCKEDFDFKSFPKLEFYSDELDHTFILEGKDLFVYDKKNYNYICLIVFDIYRQGQTGWELGLPFLRKYQIFFDFSDESLGIVEHAKEIKKSSLTELFDVIIISFVLGMIFSYIFLLKKKQGRKKRLNELDEELENKYIES